MRKLYWIVSAYLKKHGLIMVVSGIVALALFSVSISAIVQQLEVKKRHYVGVVGEYSLTSLPLFIQQQISSGLTQVNPDNTVSPLLAERWIVEEDGKTYRFLLKKGVYWQDGRELKPDDVRYDFSDVETITTPNDIVFKLPDEFVPFPSVVSAPVFRIEQKPYWLLLRRQMLIGIGPNTLEDYVKKGNKLTQVTVDTPTDKYTYRFYFTEDEAVLAFKRGEVDELVDLASSYGLENWPNVHVEKKLHTDRYLGVFFNNADPRFTKNVRQALAYAIEKPSGEERATSPIDPQSWAYLEGGKSYDKDIERAKERLLDEIPPQPLTIELTTTEIFASQAEQIKREWEEFGAQAEAACQQNSAITDKVSCERTKITVSIRVTNFPDTSNFQVLLIGQEIPPDPDQYALWHSEQSTNFTRYKNTRIDALLERGRTTPEESERRAIYQEFQQFFLEDVPAIFLQHLYSVELART